MWYRTRGGVSARGGERERRALASDVHVNPWPAAQTLFNQETHDSLPSVEQIQEREEQTDSSITDVTQAIATLMDSCETEAVNNDLAGARHDPNNRRMRIANSHYRRIREQAARDIALERRFDVFLSDAARMGFGAPWTHPLTHENRDQRDYVDWLLTSILAKFTAARLATRDTLMNAANVKKFPVCWSEVESGNANMRQLEQEAGLEDSERYIAHHFADSLEGFYLRTVQQMQRDIHPHAEEGGRVSYIHTDFERGQAGGVDSDARWAASFGRIRAGFGPSEIPTVDVDEIPVDYGAGARERRAAIARQLEGGILTEAGTPPPFPVRHLQTVESEEERRMMDILRIIHPELFPFSFE